MKSMNLGLNPAPYSLCPALVRALPGACLQDWCQERCDSSDRLCLVLSQVLAAQEASFFQENGNSNLPYCRNRNSLEDPDSLRGNI